MRFLFLFLVPAFLSALPKGEDPVLGTLDFHIENQSLNIKQHSLQAIVDWQEFSIEKGECVSFIQSQDARILNRVITDCPTYIYGKLQGDGSVYLINQNGILIGSDGRISLGSFFASTLNLCNSAFLDGKDFHFNEGEGKVQNLGEIIASKDIYLISKEIENCGFLQSENVYLYAADSAELCGAKVRLKGEGYIENAGMISALNTQMQSASSLSMLAINHSGIIEATSIEERNGEGFLSSEKGYTYLTGDIISEGGSIEIQGKHINIEDAHFDVSHIKDAGRIVIGNTLTSSLHVAEGVKIYANSYECGNGGNIYLYGHDANWFYGDVQAKGGYKGGDGGFVEFSGKSFLDLHGPIQTDAIYGKVGTILFDPNDVTVTTGASSAYTIMGITPPPPPPPPPPAFPDPVVIVFPVSATTSINDVELSSYLSFNNVVIDNIGTTGAGAGTISFAAGSTVSWASATTLNVKSVRNISVDGSITSTGTGTFTAIDFEANQTGTTTGSFAGIEVSSSGMISTVDGDISLKGVSGTSSTDVGVLNNGTITSAAGSGSIFIRGDFNPAATDSIYGAYNPGGTISSATGNITIIGNGHNGTTSIPSGGVGIIHGGGTISSTSGDISLVGMLPGSGDFGVGVGFGLNGTPILTTVDGMIEVIGTATADFQGIGIL